MEQTEASTQPPRSPSAPSAESPARRPGGFAPRRNRFYMGRDARPKKVCRFCVDRKAAIDYKDTVLLRNFITDKGKILPGRTTGVCAWHQRKLELAIKRSQVMAMLPFSVN